MLGDAKFVIITPYYKEERALLERCIRSVRAQDVPTDHILVADGHAQQWIEEEQVRHVVLDKAYRDFGNTPRGVGALLAIAEGYGGIGFLDADNWLEVDHISSCIAASREVEHCDYVIARRSWRRPDGSVIDIGDRPLSKHVDTSCFFLLPGSFHIIPYFSLMPRELSPLCDIIFYSALINAKLKFAIVKSRTINYHCLWEQIYISVGETPPPNAKKNIDWDPIQEWLKSRSPQQMKIASNRSGSDLTKFPQINTAITSDDIRRVGRNDLCSCGSGKKYKHCHGSYARRLRRRLLALRARTKGC
jgi:hypothetical protein